FFFFQAEDGIRDDLVTGVQTCALPIWAVLLEFRNRRFDAAVLHGTTTIPPVVFCGSHGGPLSSSWLYKLHRRVCARAGLQGTREIGRASCRERGEGVVARVCTIRNRVE